MTDGERHAMKKKSIRKQAFLFTFNTTFEKLIFKSKL